LDKLLEYKRSWIQHVNRMPRNRLPRVMKYYSPTGRRNHGRPLKRLLNTWDRNGSTSGPTPWKIYDDERRQSAWIFILHFWYQRKRYKNNISKYTSDLCDLCFTKQLSKFVTYLNRNFIKYSAHYIALWHLL